MDRPSTSRDPLLTKGRDSESDGGESVEAHAYVYDFNAGESVHFTDVDEDQSLTPISESTFVESVDANVLKLPGEDQTFFFVEFSPDWSLVVTVVSDGTFSLWNATDKWVLVGSKRLHHDGRTLKCIAFDPYNEKAVLLCFDSGEIFRTALREPATSDDPGSSQDQGMFRMEQVYQCKGRTYSRFDHFTFSSDRRTMVYYNVDGEFAAVWFRRQGEPKWISLSKEFVLKQHPKIYVFEKSALITAVMRSSEDHESTGESIETLFWSRLDFEYSRALNNPAELEGKGYLSGDGKYVLTSKLASKYQSTSCQLDLHLNKDVKSNMNVKHTPFTSRSLTFTSNHPHLEFLEWSKFNFVRVHHNETKPLIAIHQTNSVGNRLLLWDTDSDALIYEIDLTLNKEARKFSEVKYCWSSDYKWLGVCSIGARMIGLVCARSGVFVWTAHVPQISGEDMGFCTLEFNPSRTRFMISLGRMIFLFEPSCLSKKPQRHPIHHDFFLSQAIDECVDFEILEMAKEWPKQVLFNILLGRQGKKHRIRSFLVDAAISLHSTKITMVCQKNEGGCFLFIINYNETSSMESFWFLVLQRWNQLFLETQVSFPTKEIKGDESHKGISVFYCHNEANNNEQIVMLSSRDGVEMQVLDTELNELGGWTRLSDERCFSYRQSRNRKSVISLVDKSVFIIDLNKKSIIKSVNYSVGLSQWWERLMDGVKFFEYSHYYSSDSQDCDKEHKLFLQDRLRGFFDVSEDGEMILIGWDNEQNRSIVITPDKSEEQFQTEWDEAHESLYQCSMLTKNGKWLGFVDYNTLRDGDVIICVVDTSSNHQQRIWLGSHELLASRSLKFQHFAINFFFEVEETKEELVVLGLEETELHNKMKRFSIRIVHDAKDAPDNQTLLEDVTKLTDLDKYGKRNQPSLFNMQVAGISNFQRALIEEGESKIEEVAKYALLDNIRVSDMYLSQYDEEHNYTTLLGHALKRKKNNMVQLCLRFITYNLFTFHSASAMVKDSFFEMLFSYNEILLPILKRNSLTLKVAEIRVPAQVFKSQNAIANVVFTSDTILEPNEHFFEMAIKDLQKPTSNRHFMWTKDLGQEKKELACVSLHYIANACKVGLNGIVRKLLMFEIDSSIFKTELIRATITWKSEKLWKQRCLQELYTYLVFLVLFTSYAICIGVLGDRPFRNRLIALCISPLLGGVLVLAIRFSFDEYKQLKTYIEDGKEVFGTPMWGFKHYFWNSKWNLVDICSYFLVLLLIPIFHIMFIFGSCLKEPLFAVVAIEVLLAWFKLWYYAQPFEQTSALVLLIRNVVHDCCPFLGLASVILVGFSVSLFVLFQCCSNVPLTKATEEEGDKDEGELIHESFGSVTRSLSTLFYAMVGTFEPEVYYNHQSLSWLTTLIFICFMSLEVIVMLNMLIALMSDTVDRVKNEEDVQITISRASFIDSCEASLSAIQIEEVDKQIGKFLFVLTPKDSEYTTKRTSWKGKINVIEENIKASINALETKVMKAIEESTKANKDDKDEIRSNIQERFTQMEVLLQMTLEERKRY